MPLISAQDQETLRQIFQERLENDVNLTYFTQRESKLIIPGQECQFCRETRELLEEIAALSDRIHLKVLDFVRDDAEAQRLGIERIPAIVLEGATKGRVRYFGIPSGYEFPALIEDLIDASTGRPQLSDRSLEAVQQIDRPLHIQVFVTPT